MSAPNYARGEQRSNDSTTSGALAKAREKTALSNSFGLTPTRRRRLVPDAVNIDGYYIRLSEVKKCHKPVVYSTHSRIELRTVPDYADWLRTTTDRSSANRQQYETVVDDFRNAGFAWMHLGMHRHILHARAVGDYNGKPYIVTDEGGVSLAERVNSGQLTVASAVNIAIQICRGLEVAWLRMSLLHGCLTTDCILLDRSDTVKIADFGLPPIWNGSPESGKSYVSRFVAPELRACKQPTERGDVFSVGAILAAMLATQAHTHEGLAALVRQCLQPDPRLRPDKCRDVRVALESLASGLPELPARATDADGEDFKDEYWDSDDLKLETFGPVSCQQSKSSRFVHDGLMEHFPGNLNAAQKWIRRGKAWSSRNDHIKAEKCFRKAVEASEGGDIGLHAEALGYLAFELLDQDQMSEAWVAAQGAFGADFTCVVGWLAFAAYFHKSGSLIRAAGAIRRGLTRVPDSWDLWSSLARYAREGEQDSLEWDALNHAIELNPDDHESWYYLATLQYEREDSDAARTSVDTCLESCPSHAAAWLLRAKIFLRLGQHAEAAQCCETIREWRSELQFPVGDEELNKIERLIAVASTHQSSASKGQPPRKRTKLAQQTVGKVSGGAEAIPAETGDLRHGDSVSRTAENCGSALGQLCVSNEENAIVVRLTQTPINAAELLSALLHVVASTHEAKVILDLGDSVEFGDFRGFEATFRGILVAVARRLKPRRKLMLCRVDPSIQESLEIANFVGQVVEVLPTVEDCLRPDELI